MNYSLSRSLSLLIFVVVLVSCSKEEHEVRTFKQIFYTDTEYGILKNYLDLPEIVYDYRPVPPEHFQKAGARQPLIQNNKATLGRVLFYDKKLSHNNSVSCASCHDQKRAFADPVAFSEGFEGKHTRRNSSALGGVASFISTYGEPGNSAIAGTKVVPGNFFWDNRALSIQEQTRMTLEDPIEMGMDLSKLPFKLQEEEYYSILFRKAFLTKKIYEHFILEAIAEFVNSMITFNSKFDEGMLQTKSMELPFENFTPEENLGKSLFVENCGSCHGKNMVRTALSQANNGLDLVYQDKGIGAITKDPAFNGSFKVPMLRNIAFTGPYMHDGRFDTLEEVVEHYSSGVKNHPVLSEELKEESTGAPKRLNLSLEEKSALVAFLKTLNDEKFISDKKYSDPFKL